MDPYKAYLVVPVMVDGIQFISVGIITKSYNLPTGDANDCVEFLQGFRSYWKNHTGSQDNSCLGLVLFMSTISGHGLSPYPLPSWIVVDLCTLGDGLQIKGGNFHGSYRHSYLTFQMMLTSRPYVNHLGNNCLHMFVPLECHTLNDPGTSWRINCLSLPSASYDWVQYPVHHIIALFCFWVDTLTEVDLGPSSVHQIPVITPQTTTCLYPDSTHMTVCIITTENPFTHRSSAPSVHSQLPVATRIGSPSSNAAVCPQTYSLCLTSSMRHRTKPAPWFWTP